MAKSEKEKEMLQYFNRTIIEARVDRTVKTEKERAEYIIKALEKDTDLREFLQKKSVREYYEKKIEEVCTEKCLEKEEIIKKLKKWKLWRKVMRRSFKGVLVVLYPVLALVLTIAEFLPLLAY